MVRAEAAPLVIGEPGIHWDAEDLGKKRPSRGIRADAPHGPRGNGLLGNSKDISKFCLLVFPEIGLE